MYGIMDLRLNIEGNDAEKQELLSVCMYAYVCVCVCVCTVWDKACLNSNILSRTIHV